MVNGKLYIGQKRGEFKSTYLGSGKLLKRAVVKHGKHNFSVKVLAYGNSRLILNRLEIGLIDVYRKLYGATRLYNLADGGYRVNGIKGIVPWMKGKHHTADTKKKLSEALMGRSLTEETKAKMSVSRKGQIPWISGRHHSAEARDKIGNAHRGIPRSEEVKNKIRTTLLRRNQTGSN